MNTQNSLHCNQVSITVAQMIYQQVLHKQQFVDFNECFWWFKARIIYRIWDIYFYLNFMDKSKKLFQSLPSEFKFEKDKAVLKAKFTKLGKSKHERSIYAFQNGIVLMQRNDDTKVSGWLPLDFDTKFEILRTQVKKETDEDDRLGDITGLNFSREGVQKVLKLTASIDQIIKWRSFLGEHINQLEFHHMFRVFKKIGKGNFASVYYAERIEDGREVAVKAFSKSVAYAEENGKEAIMNEITLMRQLNHRNIMKLHEVYETSNSLYMCLELLEGGSLYDQMKNKNILTAKQVQQVIYGILYGLKYMHSKEIMHRDLKLENLVFKKANALDTIMIADFGLATRVNEKVYLYCRCGTPGYVAPEVINIKDMKSTYSSVCDIYSAGLVFHLLLTGKAAFSGKSYNTVVKMNREAKVEFKGKAFDIVPASAMDLLKRMLEKDPKKRITAAECCEHPYFAGMKAQEHDYDYIDENDEGTDLDTRMSKINDDAAKFDMLRINQLQNSPIQSPILNATKDLKNTNIDSENFMHMRSPVITGRHNSVENSPLQLEPSRMDSPMKIQPSKFKQPGQNTKSSPKSPSQSRGLNADNALYKYALKKNSINSQQQQQQQQQTQEANVKSVQKNLSQNI